VPPTEVVVFANKDGIAPLLAWLDGLPPKVQVTCIAILRRLREKGYDLRRPYCDYLRDDIYELRIRAQGINYRVLYFYHLGRAVLSHGIIKKREVPPKKIDRARSNKALYIKDPDGHAIQGTTL
jgi:phage-related protein